jgi:release factor glutamine methyltransferase
MVYEPREDTWLIVESLKDFITRISSDGRTLNRALDMGTGSGAIAGELAKCCRNVVAVDIDPEAIKAAKKKSKSKNIKFVVSDLFDKVDDKFDLIVFNPPYLPPVSQMKTSPGPFKVTEWAGGRPLILKFLKQASRKLTPAGSIILLFSSRTGLELGDLQNQGFKLNKLNERKFFYEKLWVYELIPQ